MIANSKSNQQADSLYTGKVSENSQIKIEPDTDQQLLNKNASEDFDTLEFDYRTDFGGDQALISEAKAVSQSFRFFLNRTFKNLTTLGNELWKIYNKCVDSLGKTEGEEKFNRWLDAEFGNSQNLARTAMSLSQWYNTLEPARQRLVANNVQNWSVAALKKLTSLTDKLIAVLVKSGKQTEKSIERAIAISLADELAPLPAEEGDRPVTNSDWSSLRKNFNLRPKHIKVLKHKAKNLASLSSETTPVVKVSHVNEAIAQCKEDPEILSQPPAKKAKKKKTDRSTPAESPSQDNSDEAITELISSAITGDMEKDLADSKELIDKLRQTITEKDATIAAQEEQITREFTAEREKAAIAHQSEMESLHQTLAISSPQCVYTEEDVLKKVAEACEELMSKMYTDQEIEEEISTALKRQETELKKELCTFEQVDTMIAEARAEVLSTTSTADKKKVASLQQELAEKDSVIASMSEKTEATIAQARAEEREKTASMMTEQITSLQQTLAELQRALAEKDQAIASLKEQNANSVASGSPLMKKEREAAVAQARAEEREKMAITHASKLESLQKELAEKNQALASSEEEKAAAVAEARADEQAVAWGDIKVLQEEIKSLKAQNHSLQTTLEQLGTASIQVKELKSQLADTEKEHLMKTKLLEGDLNSVVQSNHGYFERIQMLESATESMHHENRDLKDELAGYKNMEKRLHENYAKIKKAEHLQTENARLQENLQGQTDQSVLLTSRVNQLNEALSEILSMQRTLAKKEIPGFNEEGYVSPLDGQTYQGVKGIIKFVQDLVNNNFNLATT